MHDLATEGMMVAEAHVDEGNAPAVRLFDKLGFRATDHGTVFRRP